MDEHHDPPQGMAWKFKMAGLMGYDGTDLYLKFHPRTLFCYGDLADAATRRKALKHETNPTLRKAFIRDFELVTIESRPTLIKVENKLMETEGVAYCVTSAEDLKSLQIHMGDGYEELSCMVRLGGLTRPEVGIIFVQNM